MAAKKTCNFLGKMVIDFDVLKASNFHVRYASGIKKINKVRLL